MPRRLTSKEMQNELHVRATLMDRYQSAMDWLCSPATAPPHVLEPMACIDRGYVYRSVNSSFLSLYRKRREEVLGRTVSEVVGEKVFREIEKPRIDRAFTGEEIQFEDLFPSSDAETRHVFSRYYPLVEGDGSIDAVVCLAWDVTGRKQAEKRAMRARRDLEASVKDRTERLSQVIAALGREMEMRARTENELKKSRERIAKIFQAIPEAISISTMEEGFFLDVNDAFLRMTDYTREEVIGKTSMEIGLWNDPAQRARLMDTIRELGRVRNMEAKLRDKQGRTMVMLVSAEPVEVDGKPCIILVCRDITERKTLESELVRSQKMEAIGRLAGGITHDFNNLLTAIDGYCELALLKLGKPEQVRSNILKIKEVKNTASNLVRQLLAFSRRQKVTPGSLDINEVIENMQSLLRQFIGEDIELKTRLGEGIGAVYADRGHVEQIIMNLALNARDAMERGGTLVISTRPAQLDEASAQKHTGLKPGRYVCIEVCDTGKGMDEETMAHAFEPFFTTKEASRGTGLGLSTVYGIVRDNQGGISVRSEKGRGTTFEIYLPMSAETPEVPAAGAAEPEAGEVLAREGTETVLVVEDNPYVLDLITQVLGSLGYTLLKAGSGKEAFEVCDSHEGGIDLVITDIVLPGMDGPSVVKDLLTRYPGIRILYITGYPGEVVSLYGIPDVQRHLLQKPFSATALAEKVREVLDEGPDHGA
ncbi:MAG: PAS domain S-box protein, partial [Desulfomonilia bacterium]